MLIELNMNQVTDELLALAALRGAGAAPRGNEEESPQRLFTRDDIPGLRVVMRMVFAELVMELADMVNRCILDESDPDFHLPAIHQDVPIKLAVEFMHSDDLPEGMWIPLKRQMEHAVATGTLYWIYTEVDPTVATIMHTRYRAVVDALTESLRALTGSDQPMTRMPHW